MTWHVYLIPPEKFSNSQNIERFILYKDNSRIKEFLLDDVDMYLYWGESLIPDMNTIAYLIFPTIKTRSGNFYVSLTTHITEDWVYENNTALWKHSVTVDRLLNDAKDVFNEVKKLIGTDSTQHDKLIDSLAWTFEKNYWIFTKKKDQRAFKLKKLNI